MRRPDPALLGAYRRTDYTAGEGPGPAVTRIGRRSASTDALLRRMGARQGAFVTAWNPYSQPMPRGWNDRMLARLREAARRLPFAEGWGHGRGWSERHLLIAADPRRVRRLARRFRQHAIIAVRIGAPARMVVRRRALRGA
jgi:peptidoglycan/xylan/chitin deacetylase (PgdA/CDA1 family)